MKEYLQKIKALFGKMKVGHASYAKEGVHPRHDWAVVLFSFIICLLVLAGAAGYFYTLIDGGRLFVKTVEDSEGGVNINNPLFKKVVDGINAREARLLDLKQNKIKTPDPSL